MTTRAFCIVFALFILINKLVAAPSVLSKVLIADVTNSSFSLIYTSSLPGSFKVELYSDEIGLNPLYNYQITSYPTNVGENTSNQSQITAKKIIVDLAKAKGIIKLRVFGLDAETQYFVKYGFDNNVSETTMCPDSGNAFCPDVNGNLISVMTTKQSNRSQIYSNDEVFYSNDVLMLTKPDIALGELIIVAMENTRYPVSVFAGDSMPFTIYFGRYE